MSAGVGRGHTADAQGKGEAGEVHPEEFRQRHISAVQERCTQERMFESVSVLVMTSMKLK
jgi:hypothetical protein